MLLIAFLAAIGIACLATFGNWRLGVYFWIVIAVVQDPIRKVTPGSPVYLTVAFLPIYLSAFLGLIQNPSAVRDFRRSFPEIGRAFTVFSVCLACSLVQTLSIGTRGIVTGLLGAFSYAGAIPALLIGYYFVRARFDELDKVLLLFVALTSVMLVGVPLEHYGYKFSEPWLGQVGTIKVWYRWYSDTDYVAMISGFYRASEIMGWHAMILVNIAFYMIVRSPRLSWLWIPAATFGCYGVFMSGRRKMLLMVLVFLTSLLWSSGIWHRRRIISYLLVVTMVVVPILSLTIEDKYLMAFDSAVNSAGGKMTSKTVVGPLWLFPLVGPFGFGVGTLTQGAQHFGQQIQVPLVEGGLEKVMVELGIVGTVCAAFVAYLLLRRSLLSLRLSHRFPSFGLQPAVCFSLVTANIAAFMVAFQFLGDPFVSTFVGFIFGVLLSTHRLAEGHRTAVDRPMRLRDPSTPFSRADAIGAGRS